MIILQDAAFRKDAIVGFGRAEHHDEGLTVYFINVYIFNIPTPVTITYTDPILYNDDYTLLVGVFNEQARG